MANRRTGADLDSDGPVPIYHQLKQLLLDDIVAGRLGPGDRLPTEYELVERFGISRTPVTRALSELADEGVIVRHRRRGSFVNAEWQPITDERAGLSLLLPEATFVPAPTEASPEVALDVTMVEPDEVTSLLQRLAAEGSAPDVALVRLESLAALVASELVRPVEPPEAPDEAHRYPLLGPRIGGAAYAYPTAFSLTGIWLRSDLGPVPGDWDGLMHLLRTVRDTDPSVTAPLVVAGGSRGAVDALLTVVASNGPAEKKSLIFVIEGSTPSQLMFCAGSNPTRR